MDKETLEKLKQSGVYPILKEYEKIYYSKLIPGDFVRTSKGRIVRLKKVFDLYSIITLKDFQKDVDIRLKHTSICAVRQREIDLLREGDKVFINDSTEGLYGEFSFISIFEKRRSNHIKLVVKKLQEEGDDMVYIVELNKVVGILTQNLFHHGLKSNLQYDKEFVE